MSNTGLNLKEGSLKPGLLKPVIKIDVVSDVVCPWCYIGKRRLEKAMAAAADQYDFQVAYHPFELNPATPPTGVNQSAYLTEKFGGQERYQSITDHTSSVAALDGLELNFAKQAILPNTRKAHALIFAAQNSGIQVPVADAFFRAYFTDGVDLSKDANLVDIAVKSGLDKTVAETAISSDALLDSITSQEREMQNLGISAVPFFIFNSEFGVSGAQASETFIKIFDELKKADAQEAQSCDMDGNC